MSRFLVMLMPPANHPVIGYEGCDWMNRPVRKESVREFARWLKNNNCTTADIVVGKMKGWEIIPASDADAVAFKLRWY